ncbi:hypothetical protein [Nocardiopsis tropica]|uniref:FtsK domain-containing protein n=2 Tax=Nocardiopsis tropica TaxID=109330 RepID=A0ABU7L1S2_9ACTN|nr:hypothetical protein [Nocardiopsis umidischolae]MEE2055475.1 hypothetical protein [Nocardiopsis umidischolae]
MNDIALWEPIGKAKKTGTRSGAGAGAYVGPWLGTAAMIPVGWLGHLAWGDAGMVTGLASTAIAAAGSAVTWVSWRMCRARTWYAAMMAPATIGGVTAWMATVTVAGIGRPWIDLLIVGGSLLAGVSNVHTWQKSQSDPRGKNSVWDRPLPSWEEVAEVVGLGGTRMRVKQDNELRRVGTVQLRPGDTVESIQGALTAIASAMRLPRRSVRAIEDPEDCSRAEVTIVKRDVLRDPIEWHALAEEEVGISLADGPLDLGTYEDGEPFTDDLFDHHTMTVGTSGSGKSTYAKLKLIKVAARRDAVVLAVDVAKGRQTLGPVQNALLWPAYTMRDARALLAGLQRAVTARADYLGSKGLANWEKDCGLTFLHVLLEEAAQLVDIEALVKLGQLARSAGIHLEASLQRGTYTNIDTDARSNFNSRICMGTAEEADAVKVLPEYVMDAGAAPHHWADRQQGCAYAAVKSQTKERHAIPLRFHNASNTDLEEAAAALPEQDGKLDPITRAAFGKAYADYLAARDSEETTTVPDAQELTDVTTDPPEDDVDTEYEEEEPTHEPEVAHIDIDTPIGFEPGEVDFALPAPARTGREMSAAEARAHLHEQLLVWEQEGRFEFRVKELIEALTKRGVTRSRPWGIGELNRLQKEERVLHHDGGVFEIVASDRELVGV